MNTFKRTALAFGFLLATTAPVIAADPVQQNNSTAVWFENWVGLSNATMVVSEPSGKIVELFAASGTPVYELNRAEAIDGRYTYELRAATEEQVAKVNSIDNGRGDSERGTTSVSFSITGHFTVMRGVIVRPEDIEQEEG